MRTGGGCRTVDREISRFPRKERERCRKLSPNSMRPLLLLLWLVLGFVSGLPKSSQEIPPREQQTPETLSRLQKAEIEKWWPIIKAAGIKPE